MDPASRGGDAHGPGEMSYTERATTRTQCRKLTKFIRTAQYLFSDAVASLSRYSTETFLGELVSFQEKEKNEEAAAAAQKGKSRRPPHVR